MDRIEEVEAINNFMLEHPEQVKHCRRGEMFYDDSGPTYRERMSNVAKNKKPATLITCQQCGGLGRGSKYCSRECYSAAMKGVKRTPYTGQTIIMAGKEYCSQAAAAKALGMSTSAIQRRLRSGEARRVE